MNSRTTVGTILVSSLLWLFAPALFSNHALAYRDAGHFYYPLYQYVADQWTAGCVPLWNPFDNLGQPLLANATSAVLYPGKLVFALPFSFATCYGLYIVGHFLLAAVTLYSCARAWGASVTGSGLGALAYVLGGTVLFQYCNVVYLVGAAWMPAALWATERMLRQRRVIWALTLGAIMALMVLGGDPQAAYHVALAAALYVLMLWCAERRAWRKNKSSSSNRRATTSSTPVDSPRRVLCLRLFFVFLAIFSGLVLAAIQIIPSWEWAHHSNRRMHERPRSVYEMVSYVLRDDEYQAEQKIFRQAWEGFAGKVTPGTHHAHAYQFSIGPWRLAELLWPNFSGKQFPMHRRWLNAIPAEGRVWTPSLFMGVLPIVLAAGTWSGRLRSARIGWLWALVLFGVVASFGWYGVGWLIDEVVYVTSGDSANLLPVGEPFGGLYWMMMTFLPGYAYFRYPAKLFTVAALGISLLAAAGWDRARVAPQLVSRRFVGIAAATCILAITTAAILPWAGTLLLDGIPTDEFFGPCNLHGAAVDFFGGLAQTMCASAAYWWLFRRLFLAPSSAPLVSSMAMVLLATELLLAQGWMIQCAPRNSWDSPSAMASAMTERNKPIKWRPRVFRAISSTSCPVVWREKSSQDRHIEGLIWDHDTLYPNFHLQHGINLIGIDGTMVANDYETLVSTSRASSAVGVPQRRLLDALSIDYLVQSGGDGPLSMTEVYEHRLSHSRGGDGISLWRNPDSFSRTWVVPLDRVDTLAVEDLRGWVGMKKSVKETLYKGNCFRDLRETAIVFLGQKEWEDGGGKAAASVANTLNSKEPSRAIIIHDQPQRVEIQAELDSPGLVVLADQFYPGWVLTVFTNGRVEPRKMPILRTNLVMRGTVLPSGSHRLVFEFHPRNVYVGAIVSGIGSSVLVLVVLCALKKRCNLGRKM